MRKHHELSFRCTDYLNQQNTLIKIMRKHHELSSRCTDYLNQQNTLIKIIMYEMNYTIEIKKIMEEQN